MCSLSACHLRVFPYRHFLVVRRSRSSDSMQHFHPPPILRCFGSIHRHGSLPFERPAVHPLILRCPSVDLEQNKECLAISSAFRSFFLAVLDIVVRKCVMLCKKVSQYMIFDIYLYIYMPKKLDSRPRIRCAFALAVFPTHSSFVCHFLYFILPFLVPFFWSTFLATICYRIHITAMLRFTTF
ncbi:hypothetical protein BDN70DRAFT_111773 [Pholiota conissans]|uniref:Uncharacterized protein n=1 Tax=Pholiota conissans TaxID=109636 RepID=A0A9P6CZ88_9AGAR|nr:hypothetical protein BDN70DRAFT_111773 [Pholiota conissans]